MITILLSTYNGEKYLREQLDSILQQEGVEVRILARDDGSNDSTPDILYEYARNFSNIYVRICENIGCKRSFYELAETALKDYSDSEFFAFADQDDIWHHDKLKRASERISGCPPGRACLYGANFRLVNADGVQIAEPVMNKKMTLGSSMFASHVIGCTMVFNRRMLEFFLMGTPEQMYLHDSWMLRSCFAVGAFFVFDNEPVIDYRQHGDNVIGGRRSITSRLKSFFSGFGYDMSEMNRNIYNVYHDFLTEDASSLLYEISTYKNGLSNKLRLVSDHRFRSDSVLSNCKLILYVLTSRF